MARHRKENGASMAKPKSTNLNAFSSTKSNSTKHAKFQKVNGDKAGSKKLSTIAPVLQKTKKALEELLDDSESDLEDDSIGSDSNDAPNGVMLNLDIDDTDDSDSGNEFADNLAEQLEADGDQEDSKGSDSEIAEEDIALSDIESLEEEERGDIVPHQRLTINNRHALTQALKSIALPLARFAFSEHQSVVSAAPTEVVDVDDDLGRELAFYKQSLDAVNDSRKRFKSESLPFSRPKDFFAEMVKSDEHMGKVKQKLVDEAASKKAAQEARKQRDLKKFGKQVQVAKLQERDKAKRDTLEKIQIFKRKRQNEDTEEAHEQDMFDVALDDAAKPMKRNREKPGRDANKRQKKDSKFGFGGKKRFGKSGDAKSTGDLGGFSAKAMKSATFGGPKGRKPAQRPGKNRRANP